MNAGEIAGISYISSNSMPWSQQLADNLMELLMVIYDMTDEYLDCYSKPLKSYLLVLILPVRF